MKLFPPLKEISITEIEGLRIGNAQDLSHDWCHCASF